MTEQGKDGKLDEREQNPDLQLVPMRTECARLGWNVRGEYTDRISGSEKLRPALLKMLAFLRSNPGMKAMVWKLDRLSRFETTYESEWMYYGLGKRGHQIFSLTEPYCTNINPTREQELQVYLAFWIAGGERTVIGSRTKAGIAVKRACEKSPSKLHEIVGDACRWCAAPKDKIWKGGRPKGKKDGAKRSRYFGVKPQITVEELLDKK